MDGELSDSNQSDERPYAGFGTGILATAWVNADGQPVPWSSVPADCEGLRRN